MKKIVLISLFAVVNLYLFGQVDNNLHLVDADLTWQYSLIGRNVIGRRTLQTSDINNDGSTEIICGTSNYWYILNYNNLRNNYEYLWISDIYETNITRINAFDINNDNIIEICVGLNNGELKIYSGDTRKLIKTIVTSTDINPGINDIEFGDIDNDGASELVVSNNKEMIIYNPVDFSVEHILPYHAYDFKISNVDADVAFEIITSQGYVLEFDGITVKEEWVFNTELTDYSYRVKVSEIDQDGKAEIVYIKGGELSVFDADLKTLKFKIQEDNSISDAVIIDVNGDGIKEIIYGEYTWDYNLHCVNSQDQSVLWTVTSSETGITDICVGDVDGNGKLELLFGSGADGGQADYLEIFDINTRTRKWISPAMEGPFYAIDIDDVDNDGTNEIVAISYKSSAGYEGGILTVFDAVTHKIEWQSDNKLLYQNWTGIYDVQIKDIDNDNKKEIILAAGKLYEAKIIILDGITKQIKSSHLFNSPVSIPCFTNFSVDDIDADGQQEIVASNGYNYFVINPLNYSIEYTSPAFGVNNGISQIRIGNINADQTKDLVFNRYGLTVFDGLTHEMIKNYTVPCSSFDLFDMNGDGIDEIIAGTYTGDILIMNGLTFKAINTIKLSKSEIDGVVVTDLNNDGLPEIVFSADGRIYFYSTDKQYAYTRLLDTPYGEYNKIIVRDTDGNGKKQVIIGTKNKIIELSENTYKCMWFVTAKNAENLSCGATDGFIQLQPYGGATPYSCTWNNGITGVEISGLTQGTYIAHLIDQDQCEINDTTIIIQSVLKGNLLVVDESCTPSGDGAVNVNITEGKAPYNYIWNTGAVSSSINNQHHGTYNVQVKDSKNCVLNLEANVKKDTVLLEIYKNNVSCYGSRNGNINLYVSQGSYPFTYTWNTGQSGSSLYNLPYGNYIISVQDAVGCFTKDTILISQPDSMTLIAFTTPDDQLTSAFDGTATINAIGGVPPYSVYWDDPFHQTSVKALYLKNGIYHVTVRDSHYCSQMLTVVVGQAVGITEAKKLSHLKFYPNPTSGIIYLDTDSLETGPFEITVLDGVGKSLIYINNYPIASNRIPVDLTKLEPGFYILQVRTSEGIQGYKIEVIR